MKNKGEVLCLLAVKVESGFPFRFPFHVLASLADDTVHSG
jgi:hypothetical protein